MLGIFSDEAVFWKHWLDSTQQTYHRQVTALLQQFAVADYPASTAPKTVLTLEDNAAVAWKGYQTEMETQLRPEGKFASCLSWAGKMSGFALRLAGILHIAEYGAAAAPFDQYPCSAARTIQTNDRSSCFNQKIELFNTIKKSMLIKITSETLAIIIGNFNNMFENFQISAGVLFM